MQYDRIRLFHPARVSFSQHSAQLNELVGFICIGLS